MLPMRMYSFFISFSFSSIMTSLLTSRRDPSIDFSKWYVRFRILSLLCSTPFITMKYRKIGSALLLGQRDNFYTKQSPSNANMIYLKKIQCYTFFCQKHSSIISIYATYFFLFLSLKSVEMDKFYQTETNLVSWECSKYLYYKKEN